MVDMPFTRHVETFRISAPLDVAICIPVRDEAERLDACLAAVEEASLECASDHVGVVLVVNNSVDHSAAIARAWTQRTLRPAVICEVELPVGSANVAYARALSFDLAMEIAAPDAVLLATDADTRVEPGWARHLVAAIRQGGAMAAGAIVADPMELAGLPPQVRATGALEADLKAVYRAIWQRIVPGAPCIPLITAGGASMAISSAAYRDVGGLPTTGRNEDRAMVSTMLRAGRMVVSAPEAVAVTSCRLDARASAGMAEALLERCRSVDPRLDEALPDLEHFGTLALAYGVLSGQFRRIVNPGGVAGRLGIPAAMLRPTSSPSELLSRFTAVMEAAPRRNGLTRSRGEQELRAARRWLDEAALPERRIFRHQTAAPTLCTGGRALCPT